jgi:hypothetical protein
MTDQLTAQIMNVTGRDKQQKEGFHFVFIEKKEVFDFWVIETMWPSCVQILRLPIIAR